LSVAEAQNVVYAAANEATRTDYKSAGAAKQADKAALRFEKDKVKIKERKKRDAEIDKKVNAINNRMGSNDYRKGGLTLNTVDNRKK